MFHVDLFGSPGFLFFFPFGMKLGMKRFRNYLIRSLHRDVRRCCIVYFLSFFFPARVGIMEAKRLTVSLNQCDRFMISFGYVPGDLSLLSLKKIITMQYNTIFRQARKSALLDLVPVLIDQRDWPGRGGSWQFF